MAEREISGFGFQDRLELASSDDAKQLLDAVEKLVPMATSIADYKNRHKLLPDDDIQEFTVRRGKYLNGFVSFDGAEISTTRSRIELGPHVIESEMWGIFKGRDGYVVNKGRLVFDQTGTTREDVASDLAFPEFRILVP